MEIVLKLNATKLYVKSHYHHHWLYSIRIRIFIFWLFYTECNQIKTHQRTNLFIYFQVYSKSFNYIIITEKLIWWLLVSFFFLLLLLLLGRVKISKNHSCTIHSNQCDIQCPMPSSTQSPTHPYTYAWLLLSLSWILIHKPPPSTTNNISTFIRNKLHFWVYFESIVLKHKTRMNKMEREGEREKHKTKQKIREKFDSSPHSKIYPSIIYLH